MKLKVFLFLFLMKIIYYLYENKIQRKFITLREIYGLLVLWFTGSLVRNSILVSLSYKAIMEQAELKT